jgi:hypothetical protein
MTLSRRPRVGRGMQPAVRPPRRSHRCRPGRPCRGPIHSHHLCRRHHPRGRSPHRRFRRPSRLPAPGRNPDRPFRLRHRAPSTRACDDARPGRSVGGGGARRPDRARGPPAVTRALQAIPLPVVVRCGRDGAARPGALRCPVAGVHPAHPVLAHPKGRSFPSRPGASGGPGVNLSQIAVRWGPCRTPRVGIELCQLDSRCASSCFACSAPFLLSPWARRKNSASSVSPLRSASCM